MQEINLNGKTTLKITASAIVTNPALHAAIKVGLKFDLIQVKGDQWIQGDDVEWLTWTPLASEGGPKLTRDIVDGETSSYRTELQSPLYVDGTAAGQGLRDIAPGESLTVKLEFTIHGPKWPEMDAFFTKHNGAKFKAVLEVIEINSSYGKISTIGKQTFDDALKFVYTDGLLSASIGNYGFTVVAT